MPNVTAFSFFKTEGRTAGRETLPMSLPSVVTLNDRCANVPSVYGFAAFFPKPCLPDALAAGLRQVLDGKAHAHVRALMSAETVSAMKRSQHPPSPVGPRSNGNGVQSARRRPPAERCRDHRTIQTSLQTGGPDGECELAHIKKAWDGMGTSREQIEKNGADLGGAISTHRDDASGDRSPEGKRDGVAERDRSIESPKPASRCVTTPTEVREPSDGTDNEAA